MMIARIFAPQPCSSPPARSASLAGLVRLMPRPGAFIALMAASLVALITTHLLIYGDAGALCGCFAVASDRLCERRANAAREPSE